MHSMPAYQLQYWTVHLLIRTLLMPWYNPITTWFSIVLLKDGTWRSKRFRNHLTHLPQTLLLQTSSKHGTRPFTASLECIMPTQLLQASSNKTLLQTCSMHGTPLSMALFTIGATLTICLITPLLPSHKMQHQTVPAYHRQCSNASIIGTSNGQNAAPGKAKMSLELSILNLVSTVNKTGLILWMRCFQIPLLTCAVTKPQ